MNISNLPPGVTDNDIEDQQGEGLLPCPFCGYEDVGRDALMEPRCDNCGANGPKDSGAWGQAGEEVNFDMDVLWNRREPVSDPYKLEQKLGEAVAAVEYWIGVARDHGADIVALANDKDLARRASDSE